MLFGTVRDGKTNHKQTTQQTIKHSPSPDPEIRARAGFFSRLFLLWATPLLDVGTRRPLEMGDMWPLEQSEHAADACARIEAEWEAEVASAAAAAAAAAAAGTRDGTAPAAVRPPSMRRALFRAMRSDYLVASTLMLCWMLFHLAGPTFWVRNLVRHIEEGDGSVAAGIGWAFGLAINEQLRSLFVHQAMMRTFLCGTKARAGLTAMIYRKAMRLSMRAANDEVGLITNVCAADTERIMMAFVFFNMTWVTAFELFLAMFILYEVVGPAGLVGLATIVVFAPIQALVGSTLQKVRRGTVKYADERVHIVNEVLNGIKLVKLYAWELSFADRLARVRALEIRQLYKLSMLKIVTIVMVFATPTIVALATFGTYTSLGNSMSASRVFATLGIFAALRFPMALLPLAVKFFAESLVGLGRIERILFAEESPAAAALPLPLDPGAAIEVTGSFSWPVSATATAADNKSNNNENNKSNNNENNENDKSDRNGDDSSTSNFGLNGVDLRIPKGHLAAVVGRVGSGKTTLLYAMLAELGGSIDPRAKLNGDAESKPEPGSAGERGVVRRRGSCAFVPQVPFILNETLRDNILFGAPLDEPHLAAVIKACALGPDIESLAAGLDTEIGERGVSLSGGQRARVSLARGLYARADVLLLDDPLSAVDQSVAAHIFEAAFENMTRARGATIVLVTNQLTFLARSDTIVVLDGLGGVESGAPRAMMKHSAVVEMIKSGRVEQTERSDAKGDAKGGGKNGGGDKKSKRKLKGNPSKKAINPGEEGISKTEAAALADVAGAAAPRPVAAGADAPAQSDGGALKPSPSMMRAEDRGEGSVSAKTYLEYAAAAGPRYAVLGVLAFLFAGVQLLAVLAEWWVSLWTENGADRFKSDGVTTDDSYYVWVLAVIVAASVVITVLRGWTFFTLGLRAARRLHDGAFQSVLGAPMSFFDTTPRGRIVSRLTKDVDVCDDQLLDSLSDAIQFTVLTGSTMVLIAAVFPWFILPAVPLMGVYYIKQRNFRRSNRELKRLQSISRTPVLGMLTSRLHGVVSFRSAAGISAAFEERFTRTVDANQSTYVGFFIGNRHLG
jgi:ABC-type multidrug transport system fused ATPase/permease subunit